MKETTEMNDSPIERSTTGDVLKKEFLDLIEGVLGPGERSGCDRRCVDRVPARRREEVYISGVEKYRGVVSRKTVKVAFFVPLPQWRRTFNELVRRDPERIVTDRAIGQQRFRFGNDKKGVRKNLRADEVTCKRTVSRTGSWFE